MQILCWSTGPRMDVKRIIVGQSTPSASATTWLTSLCWWWARAHVYNSVEFKKQTVKQDRGSLILPPEQGYKKNLVFLLSFSGPVQLYRPLTATPTSPSLPPPGFECYYVSGLRHIHYQLCCRNHLYLQEEVMSQCCSFFSPYLLKLSQNVITEASSSMYWVKWRQMAACCPPRWWGGRVSLQLFSFFRYM